MNKIKLMVDIDEEVLKFINLHGFVKEEDRNAVNHAFLSATPFTENDDVVSRREAMYAITQSELANENYTQTKIFNKNIKLSNNFQKKIQNKLLRF